MKLLSPEQKIKNNTRAYANVYLKRNSYGVFDLELHYGTMQWGFGIMSEKLKWHTEKRIIKDLVPYERNPRRLTEKQYEDLKKSLSRFDLVEIPAIDTDNKIISGHMRLKILSELKNNDVEIDVRVPNRKLTEKEFQEFNIRANKNLGEFDYDILANEFNVDDLLEWGFDKEELLGFDFDDDDGTQDEIPPLQQEARSQIGDLYELGQHQVLCGDATKPEDVEKLMQGENADMVFTDPPYGVDYGSKNKFLNKADKGNRIQTDIKNDVIAKDAFELWGKTFETWETILQDYHSIYICSPQTRDLMMMMMMIERGGIYISNVIIWVKNNHVLGRLDYNLKHEPIIYGWLKKGKHKFYGNGKFKTSVWEVDKPLKSDLHPTTKPIELIVNAILNSTEGQNNIVLDPFLGSGSTLIACEKTGRICYGCELDPLYVDVIVQRYVDYTGNREIKLNGETVTWEAANES